LRDAFQYTKTFFNQCLIECSSGSFHWIGLTFYGSKYGEFGDDRVFTENDLDFGLKTGDLSNPLSNCLAFLQGGAKVQ